MMTITKGECSCHSLDFWMFRIQIGIWHNLHSSLNLILKPYFNVLQQQDVDGDDCDDDHGDDHVDYGDDHVDYNAGEAEVPRQLHRLKSQHSRRLGLHGSTFGNISHFQLPWQLYIPTLAIVSGDCKFRNSLTVLDDEN